MSKTVLSVRILHIPTTACRKGYVLVEDSATIEKFVNGESGLKFYKSFFRKDNRLAHLEFLGKNIGVNSNISIIGMCEYDDIIIEDTCVIGYTD